MYYDSKERIKLLPLFEEYTFYVSYIIRKDTLNIIKICKKNTMSPSILGDLEYTGIDPFKKTQLWSTCQKK